MPLQLIERRNKIPLHVNCPHNSLIERRIKVTLHVNFRLAMKFRPMDGQLVMTKKTPPTPTPIWLECRDAHFNFGGRPFKRNSQTAATRSCQELIQHGALKNRRGLLKLSLFGMDRYPAAPQGNDGTEKYLKFSLHF